MCGRYTLAVTPARLAARFGVAPLEFQPRYNIAPTQPVVAARNGQNGRELVFLRWGLIPAWAKDASIGARMINARSETALDKPAFRTAFRRRRCLLPASGFYEWQTTPAGKQPYYFSPVDDEMIAFAGLWEQWQAPDGTLIESCTILTTAANEVVAPIHDRMPVMLPSDLAALWLDPAADVARLHELCLAPPPVALRVYPVSKAVNQVRNDSEVLIRPQQV
ncbi:SOS response-associated peptidase [uncultured Chloroflexus sp.]|uniref:SOS response-associated peptidase n=1 Tax=Chloroflexus sp. TaxID=1904827 RepID=UPI00345D5872